MSAALVAAAAQQAASAGGGGSVTARLFDGTNDQLYDDYNASAGYNVGGDSAVTFAAWVRNDNTSQATGNRLLSRWGSGQNQLILQLGTSADVFRGVVRTGSATLIVDDSSHSQDVWYHIAVRFDGSGPTLTIWRDGTQIDSDTGGASGVMASSSADFMVGAGDADRTNPSLFFEGAISDLAMWNVALTSGQIGDLADGTSRPDDIATGLQVYWPLEGASPETDEADSADLTVEGATTTTRTLP